MEIVREDKEALENRISEMEEMLRVKNCELSSALTEVNKYKVGRDFKTQFDKSWKQSFESEIDHLRKELEMVSTELNSKNEQKCVVAAVFKCQKCDLIFKTAGLLRRHTRFKHSINSSEVPIKKKIYKV